MLYSTVSVFLGFFINTYLYNTEEVQWKLLPFQQNHYVYQCETVLWFRQTLPVVNLASTRSRAGKAGQPIAHSGQQELAAAAAGFAASQADMQEQGQTYDLIDRPGHPGLQRKGRNQFDQ